VSAVPSRVIAADAGDHCAASLSAWDTLCPVDARITPGRGRSMRLGAGRPRAHEVPLARSAAQRMVAMMLPLTLAYQTARAARKSWAQRAKAGRKSEGCTRFIHSEGCRSHASCFRMHLALLLRQGTGGAAHPWQTQTQTRPCQEGLWMLGRSCCPLLYMGECRTQCMARGVWQLYKPELLRGGF
jgi:hypothetical protein